MENINRHSGLRSGLDFRGSGKEVRGKGGEGERREASVVFQQPWPLLCWCLSLGQGAYPAHFFFLSSAHSYGSEWEKKNSSGRPNEFINASF